MFITMKYLIITAIGLVFALGLNAQKLDKFGMDAGKKSLMGKEIRVPYTDMVSYYGFVKPGTAADEEKGGKKYYYLYVWIPAVAPELGIRMVSPIPDGMKPGDADFQAPTYADAAGDPKTFFDTWITLERADGITSKEDIGSKGKNARWNSYGVNDDSGEMPAQPSGSKYNSLMRITSEASNPLKALVVGLYRIGFTTYKTGEVKGGFVAQVGAPVKLPGVKMGASVDALVEALKK